jgi:hypothetical protein
MKNVAHAASTRCTVPVLFDIRSVGLATILGLLSLSAQAFPINFDFTHGPVCKLVGPCQVEADVFRDPTGSFQAEVHPDGSLGFSSPFTMSFDGDSQFIEFTVVGGPLTADGSNPAVVDGVIPPGNWTGSFTYVTSSSGGVSSPLEVATNDGQTFFIDNEGDIFTLGFIQSEGDNPINILVLGVVTLAPIPVPAAALLFGSALGMLGWMRRRAA